MVVAVGLAVVDRLIELESRPEDAVRTRYRRTLRAPGGMASNALRQAAALGCAGHLVTRLGRDPDARWLLRTLREEGLHTGAVRRDAECPTSTCFVLVDGRSGERRFLVPDRRPRERGAGPFDLRILERAAVLLVDGHYPEQALLAARRARTRGIPIVADLRDDRPIHRRLLRLADHAIVPEEFLDGFLGRRPSTGWSLEAVARGLVRLRERYDVRPVITLGRRGAMALDGARAFRLPAHRVKTVDTTGAGDAFHGAFAAGLAHGLGERDSLELARHAAAACCTRLGAGPVLRLSRRS